MNIPCLYVTPPILFGEDLSADIQMEDDDGLFADLSPLELRHKWSSLLHEYATLGNEFRALERQRIATAEELARFRAEVEALEAEVIREDGAARLPK
jgi:hypothetical protein